MLSTTHLPQPLTRLVRFRADQPVVSSNYFNTDGDLSTKIATTYYAIPPSVISALLAGKPHSASTVPTWDQLSSVTLSNYLVEAVDSFAAIGTLYITVYSVLDLAGNQASINRTGLGHKFGDLSSRIDILASQPS